MFRKNCFLKVFKRYISKKQKAKAKYEHMSSSTKPLTASDLAIEYFDTVYGSYYGNKWPSIRLALKCQPKYSILYNNYSHNLDTINNLQDESHGTLKNMWDLINISSKFLKLSKYEDEEKQSESEALKVDSNDIDLQSFKTPHSEQIQSHKPKESVMDEKISRLYDFSHVPTSELIDLDAERAALDEDQFLQFARKQPPSPLEIYNEKNFHIPKNISFYAHEPGVLTTFPPSNMTNKGLLVLTHDKFTEYYIMDASSIIPILALDIKPENKILDMCAAPGGKSLAAIQTLNFGSITCVEKSLSRFRRMEKVFDVYLPKSSKFRERVKTLNADVCLQPEFRDSFDRIILDVPCTSDRKSMREEGDNLFKKSRFRERSSLPSVQVELLTNGIRNLKPGGFLVYSTCSLSPMANDAIVAAAYGQLTRTDPHLKFCVRNCQSLCQLFSPIFTFYHRGVVVINRYFNRAAERIDGYLAPLTIS